jgi:hypothetical protein
MPAGILYPYPWLNLLLHLQRRCIPSRHERPLLAKERTIYHILMNLASKSAIFGRTRFFYMPQSWEMGQIILLPLRSKACCGFSTEKIRRLRSGANPRSWVPEASMQTPRPPKPLWFSLQLPDKFCSRPNTLKQVTVTSNRYTSLAFPLQQ